MEGEEKKTGEEVRGGVRVNEAQKDEVLRGAISEDEARRLLAEEKQRVETGLKKADKRGKRVLVIVVIVAVILCVAGLVIGAVMRGKDDGGKREEVGGGMEEKTEETEEPEKPVEKEPEIEELSLDDEVVQRLYEQFDITREGPIEENIYGILRGLGGENPFIGKPVNGEGTEVGLAKIGIALGNLELQRCKKTDLVGRYAGIASWVTQEVIDTNGYNLCYDGETTKKKINEIFGEDIAFYPLRQEVNVNGSQVNLNSIISGHKVYAYDSEYDEFYPIPYGSEGMRTIGGLYAAECSENQIYLYDFYANVRCTPDPKLDENDNVVDAGSVCTVRDMDDWNRIIYSWNDDEGDLTMEKMLAMKEDFPRYKWTFVKNGEGNYVFEKVERVEN